VAAITASLLPNRYPRVWLESNFSLMTPLHHKPFSRRDFLHGSASVAGLALLPTLACSASVSSTNDHNIIGPRTGYTPQVGTLVSMMDWMRAVVLDSVQGLSQAALDHQFDPKANSIGALLLHLAAVEVYYQVNTLAGRPGFNAQEKQQWGAALDLGDEARRIRGHNLDHYLNALHEVRATTLAALRQRDDQWLMAVDPTFFGKQPTNNYCKWFHVVEHESNHNGQIKWIKSRLPGQK